VYNTNWPRFTGTVGIASGYATLSGTTLPVTALPGWFMHVGALPAAGTPVTPTATTGWVEITQIVDSTHFYVRRESSGTWPNIVWDSAFTVTAGAAANVTSGLGNAFVPPYGPWSIIRCTDCHGSTKTDPVGPHASVNKWLIKDADEILQFQWHNGTSLTTVSHATIWPAAATEKRYFCFNCHRADVYGTKALMNSGTSWTQTATTRQARMPHTMLAAGDGGRIQWDGTDTASANRTYWPQYCRHCHGGDKLGGIHGSNLATVQGDAVPQSIRFLNGATWNNGLQRPTSGSGTHTCYTQSSATAAANGVSGCSSHSGGTGGSTKGGTATYTYDGY
jgi:hypothetical protein